MDANLRCMCGKLLNEYNVCPLPSGRVCKGSTELVRPNSYKILPYHLEDAFINSDNVFFSEVLIYGYYDI